MEVSVSSERGASIDNALSVCSMSILALFSLISANSANSAIVGFLIPAVGQGVGHCGRPGLEVLEERHRSGAAFGAELEGGVKQCVGAVGGDAHFVLGIGSKAADGDIG